MAAREPPSRKLLRKEVMMKRTHLAQELLGMTVEIGI